MTRYRRECRGPHPRLLPTTGVCEQRLGVSLRLLLIAGVCKQRLGEDLRLLPTAGVCEQHLSSVLRPGNCQYMLPIYTCRPWTFAQNRCSRAQQSMCRYPWECCGSCMRHFPTAGACDQRFSASLRLFLTTGVCQQHLGEDLRHLPTAGKCNQRSCILKTIAHHRFMSSV